ncbi:phosphoribosylaminoimidazolesuccinocarboxamide synthase [bacterium]|nr:phosphoribosylaminoimidazolesuccinocarboxamide synthase [bacterium]
MQKRKKLYEGKAKILWATDDPNLLIQEFKDSLTAFDGVKKSSMGGKGSINCEITSALFKMLESKGIDTHFVKKIAPSEQVVRHLKMIQLEVIVRNYVAGSLKKRTGLPEGKEIERPIVEFYFKSDELHDPLLAFDHIFMMGFVSMAEYNYLRKAALKINEILGNFFSECGLKLVDFKLEFGRHGTDIVLGDEITPDTCRLWDEKTGEKLDKDVFRFDLGDVESVYKEVMRRVTEISV